jgi:hemolysin III
MQYKSDSVARSFTVGEILANSITHAVGVGLSIAGLVILIIRAANHGDAWHMTSFIIFGISLILLYLASMIYHSTPNFSWNAILQRLDHAAIFFLIAGTYTPFLLTKLRGPWGWSIFGIVWGLALLGLILKLGFTQRFVKPSVWLYVAMSWFAIILFNQMMQQIGSQSLALLLIGGVFYTSGILFYRWRKLPYSHAIWHLFVMGGSIFHFFSVLQLT